MSREIHWPGCKRGRSCTLRLGTKSARIARRKRWKVGDIVEGDDGYGVTRLRITAIGEEQILAIERGPGPRTEDEWALWCRCWRKVAARKGGDRG